MGISGAHHHRTHDSMWINISRRQKGQVGSKEKNVADILALSHASYTTGWL
jgi:hypothetical protein